MKKRYPFLPKNWLCVGLITAFVTAFSLNLQAQTAPVKQWDKTIGGSWNDDLGSLQKTADGGYILGGSSWSIVSGDKTKPSRGYEDYWVVKLDASGNKLWDNTIGGLDYDYLHSIKQTSDGGYILGGTSNSNYYTGEKSQNSKGGHDYWVVKLDAGGNKLWDKTFGGTDYDNLVILSQTTDGGYILGGHSLSGIGGDKSQANKGAFGTNDYWVVKLDASGNKVWDKTFGGDDNDYLSSLIQTSDGGYMLSGNSMSNISGDKTQASKGQADYWVLKLDGAGNKIWENVIGGSGYEGRPDVKQTSDGGYILGGNSGSPISGDKSQGNKGAFGTNDYWVVKLDASGSKIWDKTIGGSGNDLLSVIQQTSDGGYILGGESYSVVSGDKSETNYGNFYTTTDYWVVKLNAGGNKVWDKTFGGSDNDYILALEQTSDTGFIIGGSSKSNISGNKTQNSKGNTDYWIIKLGADITGIKESEANFNLTISPNPNHGKFTLQLSNLTAPKAEVTISDLLGRVVLQKEFQTINNLLSEELTLPNTKGIYLLQVKAGEHTITRKIVVE